MSDRRYTIRTEVRLGEWLEAEYHLHYSELVRQKRKPLSMNKFLEALLSEGLETRRSRRRGAQEVQASE